MTTHLRISLQIFWFLFFCLICEKSFSQPVYADMLIGYTSCPSPCGQVLNPSYSADGNLETYSSLNSLGLVNTTEVVVGFSSPGAPGSMVVIPLKISASLLGANLLSNVSVDVLDASNNVIIQKSGFGTLDINLLGSGNETSTVTLFTPPSGSYQIAKIRVKLVGALNIQGTVMVGDPFYVEPSGAGCGIRYADIATSGSFGLCIGCYVKDRNNAVDNNFTNYAEMKVLAGLLGAGVYLKLEFPTEGHAGDYVGVIMGNGGGLLDLSVLGNVSVTTYKGNTAKTTYSASSLLGASLLTGSQEYSMVGFNANETFDAVVISIAGVASVGTTMYVYGAVTYDPTPTMVELTVAPKDTICEGTTAQISATGGYAGYVWSSGQSSQNISVGTAGSYAVVAEDANGCPFYSLPKKINVLNKPTVPTVTADPLNCLGGNVRFVLNSSNTAYTYQILEGGSVLEGDKKAGTGSSMEMFSVPVSSSKTYRIQVTDTATQCKATNVSDINIVAPSAPTQLALESDQAKCWVKPGDRYVHFIQPGTTRILASVNPKNNDLGEVEVHSYVNATPIDVQACGTYQPWFVTTVLNRRWLIEPTQQPTSPVDVRLYFDNAEFTALSSKASLNANLNDDVSSISGLVLSKYDGLNEDGNFENNCGNGTTEMYNVAKNGLASADFTSFQAGGRFVDYTVPGFSEFWLHGNNNENVSALPIVLTDFWVQCNDGQAEIVWVTESEINNESFTVSRSTDAITWEPVQTVPGAINSNNVLEYSITDSRPLSGISYYRLHQTDLDGKQEYFEPVSAYCTHGGQTEVSIYPNPAEIYFNISVITSTDEEFVPMEIYTLEGRVVITDFLRVLKDKNEYTFNISELNSGAYFVKLGFREGTVIKKLILN